MRFSRTIYPLSRIASAVPTLPWCELLRQVTAAPFVSLTPCLSLFGRQGVGAVTALPIFRLRRVSEAAENTQLRDFAQAAFHLRKTGKLGQGDHGVPQLD